MILSYNCRWEIAGCKQKHKVARHLSEDDSIKQSLKDDELTVKQRKNKRKAEKKKAETAAANKVQEERLQKYRQDQQRNLKQEARRKQYGVLSMSYNY